MLLWTKFMNWLKGPAPDTTNSQTAAMAGLVTMTSPATTAVIVQTVYSKPVDKPITVAEPVVETPAVEETEVKVKKTRSKSAEPRVKKPRPPRKPKTNASNPA